MNSDEIPCSLENSLRSLAIRASSLEAAGAFSSAYRSNIDFVVVGSMTSRLISVAPRVTPSDTACGPRTPGPKAREAVWKSVEAATTEK